MALSSSGSISLSQIQSEWGGSNPISLSEYYNGALANNALSDTETCTVASTSTSQYYPATKLIGAYTLYNYYNGWVNYNIQSLGSYHTSATATKLSGSDKVGNAGTVPSSGTIQMNHFRGTDAPVATNYVFYGWINENTVAIGTSYRMYVYLSGHWGSNNESTSWSGVPFRYIYSPAEGSMPATYWHGSDAHSTNGGNTGKFSKTHLSYPNIGNVTRFTWTTNNYTNLGFSGTINLTFQF
tara:strand:+ start:14 stop:733 length:720 start_codon:yes stop_codon:yes gene_type:complete